MSKTIVFDPGYSNVKWTYIANGKVHGPHRAPTAVAEVPGWAVQVDLPGASGEIEWRGGRFLFGEEALVAGLPLPTLADGFLIEVAIPVFLRHLRTKDHFDQIVMLLSPADMNLKPRIESVVKEAVGDIPIRFVAQGTGMWVEAGRPSDAIIVDIGFHTTDVILVSAGQLRRDLSFAVRGAGLVSFLEKIERDDPFMLARRLEDGDERLRQLVEQHYWTWLERQLQARTEWRRRPTHAKIIAGGGGAYFLRGVKGISVVKHPETANVRGVAKLLLQSQGGEA